MIRIDVTDTVETVNYKGKNGQPATLRLQQCYAHVVGLKYPVLTKLALWAEDSPHAVGEYTLAPESIEVDERGRLSLHPKLLRVRKAA